MKKLLILFLLPVSLLGQKINGVYTRSVLTAQRPPQCTTCLVIESNDSTGVDSVGLFIYDKDDVTSVAGADIIVNTAKNWRFKRVRLAGAINFGAGGYYTKAESAALLTPKVNKASGLLNNYIPLYQTTGNELINSALYQSSGNIGLGLTNPTQKLDVLGNIRLSGNFISNSLGFKFTNALGKVHATMDTASLTMYWGPLRTRFAAGGVVAIDTNETDDAGGFGINAKSFSVNVGGFAGLYVSDYATGAYTKMGNGFSTSYAVIGQTTSTKHTRSRLQIGNQGAINRLELNASNDATKTVFLEDSAGVAMLGTAGNSKYRLLPAEIEETISGTKVRRVVLEGDKVTELVGYQGGTERSQVALKLQGYSGEDDDEATLFSVDGDEDLMTVGAKGHLKVQPAGDIFLMGNVGVGTLSPSDKLTVSGIVKATGYKIGTTTLFDQTGTYSRLFDYSGTPTLVLGSSGDEATISTNTYFIFKNRANSAEVARVTDTGVGIKTTSPAAPLDVNGAVVFRPMAASAVPTAVEGMIVCVNTTNGTFTSAGFWGYLNGVWTKLTN